MAADYDLAVIGNSVAGVWAARSAAQRQAKVALINQDAASQDWLTATFLSQQTLAVLGYLRAEMQFGQNWTKGQAYTKQIAEALHWPADPIDLAQIGVDVISGCGAFREDGVFGVHDRPIRARTYLIATGARPIVPDLPGLANTPHLTPASLWDSSLLTTPNQTVLIVGHTPTSAVLAQGLNRLGLGVTLVTGTQPLLPNADRELADLVQAQLEVEGIRLLSGQGIDQVRQIEGRPWAQVGKQAIAADYLLVCAGLSPNLADLNLSAVGVRWDALGLRLDSYLRTTHHRIYGCNTSVQDYPLLNIATHQAEVAVQNALLWPKRRLKAQSLPLVVHTAPPLAQVGLTESQARDRYGKAVLVLRQPLHNLASAQIQNCVPGLAKLVIHRQGRLLGAHFWHRQATLASLPATLALQRKVSLAELATIADPTEPSAAIWSGLASQWTAFRHRRDSFWGNLFEGYFNWQRSWF